MGDHLPPLPATAGPDPVALTALAMAAQRFVSEELAKTQGPYITRKECEEILHKGLVEGFRQIGVELDKSDSVKAFNATIAHAETSRTMWDKAKTSMWSALWFGVMGLIGAALTKYFGLPAR